MVQPEMAILKGTYGQMMIKLIKNHSLICQVDPFLGLNHDRSSAQGVAKNIGSIATMHGVVCGLLKNGLSIWFMEVYGLNRWFCLIRIT
jgi:hypothetical protein